MACLDILSDDDGDAGGAEAAVSTAAVPELAVAAAKATAGTDILSDDDDDGNTGLAKQGPAPPQPAPVAAPAQEILQGPPDLARLHQGEMLNDAVLDFFLRALAKRLGKGAVHAFSALFFGRLAEAGYDCVRTWTRGLRREAKEGIFAKDVLIVPVHDPEAAHWWLAVVLDPRAAGGSEGAAATGAARTRVVLLDSLSQEDPEAAGRRQGAAVELLRGYLAREWAECTGGCYAPERVEALAPDAPQQTNDIDCGLYVLEFALQLLQCPASLGAVRAGSSSTPLRVPWDEGGLRSRWLEISEDLLRPDADPNRTWPVPSQPQACTAPAAVPGGGSVDVAESSDEELLAAPSGAPEAAGVSAAAATAEAVGAASGVEAPAAGGGAAQPPKAKAKAPAKAKAKAKAPAKAGAPPAAAAGSPVSAAGPPVAAAAAGGEAPAAAAGSGAVGPLAKAPPQRAAAPAKAAAPPPARGAGEAEEEEEDEVLSAAPAPAPSGPKAAGQPLPCKRAAAPEGAAPAVPAEGPARKAARAEPKDAKAQGGAKLSKGEMEAQVLQYMVQQNRPYNAQNVFDNLHGAVPKGQVQASLEALVLSGGLVAKEYGKFKYYLAKQAPVQEGDAQEDTAALQAEIDSRAPGLKELRSLVADARKQAGELRGARGAREEAEQACREAAELAQRAAELQKAPEGGGEVEQVDPREAERLEAELRGALAAWRQRRRLCLDALGALSEGMGVKLSKLVERYGVDTDEEAGHALPPA